MPSHDFICQLCGFTTTQFGTVVFHPCTKNKNELTELIRADTTSPIDICCDGCGAERLGEEHHAYSDKIARESAREAGWECGRKGDWCPRCVAEKKHVLS
jgi:hypothetical protein